MILVRFWARRRRRGFLAGPDPAHVARWLVVVHRARLYGQLWRDLLVLRTPRSVSGRLAFA